MKNNQVIKEMPKRKENEHREPSSNSTPQKPLHGDRLPPQPNLNPLLVLLDALSSLPASPIVGVTLHLLSLRSRDHNQ